MTVSQHHPKSGRRIRNIWIAALVLCIDAWLSLLVLWFLPELMESDALPRVARSLAWIIALSVCCAVLCCLVVLALIPKHASQLGIVNQTNCTLVMASAIAALFLCIVYEGVF